MKYRVLIQFLLVVLAMGCSRSVTNGGGGNNGTENNGTENNGGGGGISADRLDEEFHTLMCDVTFNCEKTHPEIFNLFLWYSRFESEQDCLAAAGEPGTKLLRVFVNPDAVATGNTTYDPEEAENCLSSFREAACGESSLQHVPECLDHEGTLAPGDSCQHDQECITLACETSDPTCEGDRCEACSTCSSQGCAGSCTDDERCVRHECDALQTAHSVDGEVGCYDRCADEPPACGEGETCTDGVCIPEDTSNVQPVYECAPRIGEDEPCDWDYECADGLFCGFDDTCEPDNSGEQGSACEQTHECQAGLVCMFSLCQRIELADEDESCGAGDDALTVCSPGFYCEGCPGYECPEGGTCRPVKAPGEECTETPECHAILQCADDGTCQPFETGDQGDAQVGDACTSDIDCASSFCHEATCKELVCEK